MTDSGDHPAATDPHCHQKPGKYAPCEGNQWIEFEVHEGDRSSPIRFLAPAVELAGNAGTGVAASDQLPEIGPQRPQEEHE